MKRILVVEDNEQNMYLITFILEKHGYEVLGVRTGELGLEAVKKEKLDLVIMDIQLPGIDGLETVKQIREMEMFKDLRIVALTSYAMTGDSDKALQAGCNGYMEKPIEPETFMTDLEKFL